MSPFLKWMPQILIAIGSVVGDKVLDLFIDGTNGHTRHCCEVGESLAESAEPMPLWDEQAWEWGEQMPLWEWGEQAWEWDEQMPLWEWGEQAWEWDEQTWTWDERDEQTEFWNW